MQLSVFRISTFLTTVLIGASVAGCRGEEAAALPERIRPVRFGTVLLSDGLEEESYTGSISAGAEAEISFRVAGTITDVRVKLGDRVRKGQVLAILDAADFSVQARQASAQAKGSDAQVQSAETQLIAARSAYQRIERLYENNSVSLSDFEQARSQLESAQGSLDAARAQAAAAGEQVAAARNQVAYTQLKAPFDGVVAELMAEANEYFTSGKTVALLASEGDPQVELSVPESLVAAVSPGDSVWVRVSALRGTLLRGEIAEVAFAAGDAPSYPVKVNIIDPPQGLRPGMAAAVSFQVRERATSQATALIAPVEAVAEGPQGRFVFLLVQADTLGPNERLVRRTNVEIGELLDEGFAIRSGLAAGDLVATAGLSDLLDGQQVRLLNAAEPSMSGPAPAAATQ